MKRPSLTPGKFPRARRIHSARVAAMKNLTHERIAVNLGISPMRLVLLCERHGIDVRRAPGRVVGPPRDTEKSDKAARACAGTRRLSEERAEEQTRSREEFGGYVEVMGRMVWKPGKRRACPAFTTASLRAAETGEPIAYDPPPLASLGECEAERKPVVPGKRRVNPAGSWGHSGAAHYLAAAEVSRRKRVAKIAKPSKRAGGEVRA